MIEKYPAMPFDEISIVPREDEPQLPVYSFENWVDVHARRIQERKSPTPSPFAPVTRRRMVSPDAAEKLGRQEIANVAVIDRYKSVLHAYKHHRRPPEIQDVFDDLK